MGARVLFISLTLAATLHNINHNYGKITQLNVNRYCESLKNSDSVMCVCVSMNGRLTGAPMSSSNGPPAVSLPFMC